MYCPPDNLPTNEYYFCIALANTFGSDIFLKREIYNCDMSTMVPINQCNHTMMINNNLGITPDESPLLYNLKRVLFAKTCCSC